MPCMDTRTDVRAELYAALNNIVMGCLVQHTTYQQAVLPRRIAAPYYARYTEGMRYGDHIDDPIMGSGGDRYRSDVSTTVFLSAPDEYDDGELVITTLSKQAMPMIRYRTKDITRLRREPCPCGRTLRRIRRIERPSGEMLIVLRIG